MLRQLRAADQRFALNRPFRISRGTKTEAAVIAVEIACGGVTGRGEGVPYARYGETVESALAAVESARGAIEGGAGRDELGRLLAPGAARNALDCALWDLETRQRGEPVHTRLGQPPLVPIASAHTIVIDTPAAMGAAAAALAQVPLLKVKVDTAAPEAQVRAVRQAAPDCALIVDPNESWDEAMLRALAPVLVELNVAVLEQPVPAGDDDWLAGYRCPVPICADEAVHVAADLDRVAARYDAVNVKLDKAGGLTAALELTQAARARGLGLMSGCMVCSSLSIAPALHIARLADWVDLDGPLWLAEDRPGGVVDRGGYLVPPQEGFWG